QSRAGISISGIRHPKIRNKFIPREVRDLIREKNRLRRQWQRTLNLVLKAEYNQMAKRTKTALDEFLKVKKKQRATLLPIHGARGVVFAETLERQCSPVYEDADDASPAILPIPMEASGRGQLLTYQSLPGQG
ncbi:hypothetical protein Trydic_g18442, partial [Trypoxylus dichotomus]